MYCHACRGNFVAELDMGLNGNHQIDCPHCGHTHYRVVENGRVTGDRWRSSMQTYTSSTFTTGSVYTDSTSTSYFTFSSWMNSSNAGTT